MKKITGIVIHGEKLGRKIGFPTANIAYKKNDIEDSVFHLNIVIDGEILEGMGSYMVQKKVFEAHIFHFDKDIYGKEIEVILLKQIRDNRRFNSLEELTSQIQQDQILIQKQILPILTFGSFDVVHKGHEHYLGEARKYGTKLITIIATDINIERIKGNHPLHSTLERAEAVLELGISDTVVAGSNDSPMQWLEKYKPHVICLGYDQRGKFVEALPQKLSELGLQTEIIKIESFEPEKYKSSLLKKK